MHIPLTPLPHFPCGQHRFMQKLLEQPERKIRSWSEACAHQLELEQDRDARILEILGKAVEGKRFTIFATEDANSGTSTVYLGGKEIPNALTDVQTYQGIVDKLASGWNKVSLADYPGIFLTESEHDHFLFIKKKDGTLREEDCLFWLLARKLGGDLYKSIHIANEWKKPEGGYEYTDTLYMWIKKDAFEDVKKAFQLKCEASDDPSSMNVDSD